MDATEYYAYDYFLRETAEPLRHISPSSEWVQLALQMSCDAKAVMTAIAAVGAAHRAHSHISHASLAGLILPDDQTATMKLYGRAVAALQDQIDAVVEHQATLEPVLLACLLLVCYEVLLNRHQQAVTHCKMGWGIIEKSCFRTKTTENGIGVRSQATVGFLVEAFRKLGGDVLGTADAHRTMSDVDATWSSTLRPDTLQQLSLRLNDLIEEGEEVLEQLRQAAKSHLCNTHPDNSDTDATYCLTYCLSRSVALPSGSGLQTRLRSTIESHRSWLSIYKVYLRLASTARSRELLMLRLRYITSYISLATCRETFEILVDRFEQEFIQILDLVDEYLAWNCEKSAQPVLSPDFSAKDADAGVSLAVGVIPALRLVAFKSRTSRIRHRALDIMFTARRREGLSWSPVVAAIAECVVAHEEQAARALQPNLPPGSCNLSCEQVPEQVRFADVITHGMRGNRVMIKLVCARYAHETDGRINLTKLQGHGQPSNSQTTGRSFFDVKAINNISWESELRSDATWTPLDRSRR